MLEPRWPYFRVTVGIVVVSGVWLPVVMTNSLGVFEGLELVGCWSDRTALSRIFFSESFVHHVLEVASLKVRGLEAGSLSPILAAPLLPP